MSLIRLVMACLFVVSGLGGIYVGLSGWGSDDAAATVVLSGFLALSGAAFLIHKSGLFASLLAAPADDAPTPDVDVVTEEKTEVDAQDSLGAYSAEQWKRILPDKPGRTVWIGPKKPGSVKLSVLDEISADIDRALDVFYAGGTPEGGSLPPSCTTVMTPGRTVDSTGAWRASTVNSPSVPGTVTCWNICGHSAGCPFA